jgi:hypothetical protein
VQHNAATRNAAVDGKEALIEDKRAWETMIKEYGNNARSIQPQKILKCLGLIKVISLDALGSGVREDTETDVTDPLCHLYCMRASDIVEG